MNRLRHSAGLVAALSVLVMGCENATNPTELSEEGGPASLATGNLLSSESFLLAAAGAETLHTYIAPPIPWRRGWTSVVARVHGRDYRIFTTHLETQSAGSINAAQGAELIAAAASSALPVILVGDFNSAGNPTAPEDRKTATYGNIVASGYADAWLAFGGGVDDGLTAYNEPADYDQRPDFVFLKGFRTADYVAVVGAEEEDRTPSGLWASDHAGVVARIRLR